MFKIASCILVAACISFQQQAVVAASLPNPLGSWGSKGLLGSLESLLDNAQNKVSDARDNALDKISDARDKISGVQDNVLDQISDAQDNAQDKLSDIKDKFSGIFKRGDEVLQGLGGGVTNIGEKLNDGLANEVQRLQEKAKQFLEEAQDANISSCNRLYKKGRAALAELVSMFDSCVLKQMQQTGGQIQDLVNVISDLQKNLSNQLQDVTQCFKSTSNFGACFSQTLQSFYKLGLTVEKIIRIAIQFYTFVPSLKFCCQTSIVKFATKNMFGLLKDVGSCVQSTVRNIQ
ncbi:PREDICTED: uncharacterized protein LOC106742540 [Dinoponera quadriceps]|uniref:Uncharacterized protein LOC106742540 n=1 Tax=Dinoponera quadriceps TaxID=609295 RepID=A0A6P3WZL1_DINQU|nr:PREDICTED: uncharacterized protein LOC106742540 [Dinoponera quadriceps]